MLDVRLPLGRGLVETVLLTPPYHGHGREEPDGPLKFRQSTPHVIPEKAEAPESRERARARAWLPCSTKVLPPGQ